MKKKILCLTAVVMSMLLGGCSMDKLQESMQENAKSQMLEKAEEAAKGFKMGTVTDGVYSSDFSGIKFTAPADWTFMSQEEIYEMMGLSLEIVGENYSEFEKEIAGKTSVTDMMCQNMTTGENLIIMYENMAAYNVNLEKFTGDDYINTINESFKNVTEMNVTELSRENIILGGVDFLKVTYSSEMPSLNYTTTQIYYVAKIDNYMMSIIASQGVATDSIAQYESNFSAK